MRDEGKKHFSPHLRGLAHQQAKKSGGSMSKPKSEPADQGHERAPAATIEHAGVGTEHSKMHGTQPHPVTGVHSVHIYHIGGGKATTHTHHDDETKGEHGIESQEHGSMDEAHAHAKEQLPPEGESAQHEEPDGDEYASGGGDGSAALPALGEMA